VRDHEFFGKIDLVPVRAYSSTQDSRDRGSGFESLTTIIGSLEVGLTQRTALVCDGRMVRRSEY
jgi:hypothetical protein